MADNAAFPLTRLSVTEKYSDLKLVCEGKEFMVHKVVVCTQSPVISAACDGEFQEAVTNTIHIKAFDPITVKRMIEYLYTKEYKVNLEDHRLEDVEAECQPNDKRDSFTQPASDDKSINNDGDHDGEADSKSDSENDTSETLICHVRVNAIADYYHIPLLKELANEEIQKIIHSHWTADGFSDVIQEVYDTTSDKTLREMMAVTAARHIAELIQLQDFTGLPVPSSFYVDTMKILVANHAEMMTTMSHLVDKTETISKANEAALKAAKDDVFKTTTAYGNAVALLRRTKICRNAVCDAEFTCHLEGDVTPVLRCSKCNCKHQP